MKTEELFYKDAYIKKFSAKVLSSVKCENGYKSILDKTAFFYEGGGQPCDMGALDNVAVFDVQKTDDEIFHFTKEPLTVGKTVEGKLDFERRFSFMQNHSGEHIVSGIIHRKFGYDNVGFHLNDEFVTFDFNGGFTREELDEIELSANIAVWENHPIKTYFPSDDELKNIDYRSKKELLGKIRIVDVDGVDVCACCAPHVKSTGEIGVIKLLDFEKLRGGTRIYLKCGKYAISDYSNTFKNASSIANELSAKRDEVYAYFKSFKEKYEDEKRNNTELKRKLSDIIADGFDTQKRFIEVQSFDIKELQVLADTVFKKHNKTVMAISKSQNGYSFAICGNETECDTYFNELKTKLNIKGGGRGGMITGVINAEDIKDII